MKTNEDNNGETSKVMIWKYPILLFVVLVTITIIMETTMVFVPIPFLTPNYDLRFDLGLIAILITIGEIMLHKFILVTMFVLVGSFIERT